MQYSEFPPIAGLAPFVQCVWTLEGHVDALGGEPQVVLPDGRTELILHFGDPFDRIDDVDGQRTVTRQAAILFAGQLTRQLVLQPTGSIGVLGLRFHPFGAAALLPQPQAALAGQTRAISALSADLSRDLESVRAKFTSPVESADATQNTVLPHIDPSRLDERIRDVCRAIDESAGLAPIDDLAAQSGMTRRHLERRFLEVVGMTPKRLARIARFQRAVRHLEGVEDGARPGGAVTAATCGYADQAHFIRDFKDLAGCPPGEHLVTKGILTGFFTR
jgi:AraC-like DNA-binding protein